MDATHLDLAHWRARLEESGDSFVRAASAQDFSTFLYRPGPEDAQGAHGRAETYFVVSGSGEFESGFTKAAFTAGDALFVPAGEAHRFIDAGDSLVWAVFFGAPIDGIWRGEGGNSTLDLALPSQPPAARVWSARWTGVAADEEGLGLVIGQHMVCVRRQDNVDAGVVVYDRNDDGSLSATWAHSAIEPNRPGGGSATRTAEGDGAFGGSYEIQYTSSAGNQIQPPWQLDISPGADFVQLTWRSDDNELRGVGFVRSGRLFAIWSRAIDHEKTALSLLDLPVAGAAGAVLEEFINPVSGDVGQRTWRRGNH